MLGFFRRFTNSKVGIVVTFAVLGIIALAFAAGDVTGLSSAGGITAADVAEVGGESVLETELVTQAKNTLRDIQQQQPTADMAGLIQAGGVERLLEQLIDQRAAAKFGEQQGIVISKKGIDGVIASIPAFRGPDGKFSQVAFEGALAQQRMSERDLRRDIANQRIIQYLTAPANGGARVPTQVALPYASLLLERRKGAIGLIPAAAVGLGAAPTDAELAAFYKTTSSATPCRSAARCATPWSPPTASRRRPHQPRPICRPRSRPSLRASPPAKSVPHRSRWCSTRPPPTLWPPRFAVAWHSTPRPVPSGWRPVR